jgi:hypothetical protein
MKLFRYDDTDTFVAADAEDAWAALVEALGGSREDYDDPPGEHEMEELPDDKQLTIWCDPDGHPHEPFGKGNAPVTKTAAEWAASEPRGMLCSTEF